MLLPPLTFTFRSQSFNSGVLHRDGVFARRDLYVGRSVAYETPVDRDVSAWRSWL
jgi:hypothetical protein